MVLVICGIFIEVNKNDVKTMRLYIKPPDGKVVVSAPLSMSSIEIEHFVHSKIDWIKKHLKKFETHPAKSNQGYKTGQSFYLWGDEYILQIENGKKNSLEIIKNKAVFTVRKNSTEQQREKFIRAWYRRQLIPEIERLLPKWEKKTRLECASWQIKYMKARWGSCKIKKRNIYFNLQLAKKPPECLEYVILHELVHFKERYHNDRFYSIMTKYMPDWKKIKSVLNG